MLRQYLKFTYRSFINNKLYGSINVLGLAMGIAILLLISIFVSHELMTDRVYKNARHIYRLVETKDKHIYTPAIAGEWLQTQHPELKVTRQRNIDGYFRYENINYDLKDFMLIDSTGLDVYQFEFLEGNPESALRDRLSLVLTESYAKKIFGNESALGKQLSFYGQLDMEVRGVIKDLPDNVSTSAQAIGLFDAVTLFWGDGIYKEEGNWSFTVFFQAPANFDANSFSEKIAVSMKERFGRDTKWGIQPFTDIYFDTVIRDEARHGNKDFIYLFISIAILIIVIACINFVNLSTARAKVRFKEIAVKGAIGASKSKLIAQLLMESVLLCLLALGVSFVLAEAFKTPFYNALEQELMVSSLYTIKSLSVIVGGTVLLGLIAGWYPAVHLTRYKTVDLLKGEGRKGSRKGNFRKILTLIQFCISTALIIGTILVSKQLNFAYNKDLGFQSDALVSFTARGMEYSKGMLLKEFGEIPGVKGMAFGDSPGDVKNGMIAMIDEREIKMRHAYIDERFLDLIDVEIVAGKNFLSDNDSVNDKYFMINESALKYLGWKTYNERKIWGKECIGVIKDYHFESLHKQIGPLFFTHRSGIDEFNLKLDKNQVRASMKRIEETWKRLLPDTPFDYTFARDFYDRKYRAEQNMSKLMIYFTLLSIFIALLGLFGMVYFSMEQRIKEIGIRKVLGAEMGHITSIFAREYLFLILIAALIAIPASYYYLNTWLANFAYRTEISWWIYLVAICLNAILTFAILLGKTAHTLRSEPVKALKYE